MLMVVVVFALSGCGEQGASPAEKAAASKSAVDERAAKARQEALAKKKAKQTAIYEECRSVAVGLDDKLNNLIPGWASGCHSRSTEGVWVTPRWRTTRLCGRGRHAVV